MQFALFETAKVGGHGTYEYGFVGDFIDSKKFNKTPPVNIVKGMDMTAPEIITQDDVCHGIAANNTTKLNPCIPAICLKAAGLSLPGSHISKFGNF